MAGRVGDLAGFIRGLENISKALFKYQSNEWSRIWMNSSLRTAVEECTTKTKETCTSYSKPSYSTQEKPEQDSASDDVIKEKKIFSSESDFNTNFQSDSVVRDSSRENDKKQEHKKVSTVKTTNLPRNASERISQEETPSAVKTNQPAKQAPVKTDSATFLMSEENKLNPSSRQRRVPVSRVSRLVNYGGLAAGLGIGALAEVARRSVGLGDKAKSPFLTEANAERIVNTLCRVRGAALKLGQLLSIQDNSMISPQWQAIFERVRQSADFMPSSQTLKVMNKELGPDWRSKVSSFDEKPFAAASIGQVHLATLKNGRKVAVKVQYPGVAKSIDSDINNLMAVLNVWEILPPGMYIESAIEVAKTELAWEVDYIREAKYCRLFRELLKDYPAYYVPEVIDDLSTKLVFTTEYIEGLPLDHCIDFDQETRNWLGESILKLCLIELFKFRVMQTDPNWSNFYYNPQTGKINLLDFGASRDFPKPFIDKYISIIKSATVGDTEAVLKGSREIGFLTGYETKIMEEAHVDAVMILGESFAKDGEFDFGTQNTTNRIQNLIPVMIKHRLTPPPKEAYSLHKKMSGAFLLCNKLKCRIRCKDIFDDVWKNYRFGDEDKLI